MRCQSPATGADCTFVTIGDIGSKPYNTTPPSLAAAVQSLGRSNRWALTRVQPLHFDSFHPQGMCRFDGRYYVTTVDVHSNRGVVIVFGADGVELDRIDVTQGARYHPGGFSFVGRSAVVAVAEYRPSGSTTLCRIDLVTHDVVPLCEYPDHLGAVLELPSGDFVAGTWGSRELVRIGPDGREIMTVSNPSHFVDFQDMQLTSDSSAVCTGVIEIDVRGTPHQLGGISHLDVETLTLFHEVPFTRLHGDRVATCNPTWFEVDDRTLTMYAVPNDGRSDLLTWTTQIPTSPSMPDT